MIRHITRYAGPEGNYPPGFVHELADGVARALIIGGYAESMEPEPTTVEPHPAPTDAAPAPKPAPRPHPKSRRR